MIGRFYILMESIPGHMSSSPVGFVFLDLIFSVQRFVDRCWFCPFELTTLVVIGTAYTGSCKSTTIKDINSVIGIVMT